MRDGARGKVESADDVSKDGLGMAGRTSTAFSSRKWPKSGSDFPQKLVKKKLSRVRFLGFLDGQGTLQTLFNVFFDTFFGNF